MLYDHQKIPLNVLKSSFETHHGSMLVKRQALHTVEEIVIKEAEAFADRLYNSIPEEDSWFSWSYIAGEVKAVFNGLLVELSKADPLAVADYQHQLSKRIGECYNSSSTNTVVVKDKLIEKWGNTYKIRVADDTDWPIFFSDDGIEITLLTVSKTGYEDTAPLVIAIEVPYFASSDDLTDISIKWSEYFTKSSIVNPSNLVNGIISDLNKLFGDRGKATLSVGDNYIHGVGDAKHMLITLLQPVDWKDRDA